ncbi:hypothetical protein UFOVP1662_7 [uncultured Caudovirales phage]|uniref:Uncharacterized protein n=1 Tax=uncultured Caudovirales phage TaxID=2100421 RepID=A0A6J5QFS8_9CAUD|nr:hypothetical protein UFOVP883_8 [uncultured Caudovirales phage]CAB4180300.1 hypothetical protein UFOVP1050_21 [uncultured Caudovirales phage]CAB4181217.1 hypothetical protein UFOVP1059_23 [uncultured Caudovirales phage]CAB4194990.1 hypothetical protein UFOVP1274_18 [uncultured Caudovirales phage]CAB4222919.1 hypothetical protein UFOVP1662_7 [uncultured Caudovirales phage]
MKNVKAMAASWARSFLAASVACYLAGVTDPKALLNAGVAALLPVILRWLNPKDSAFGINK